MTLNNTKKMEGSNKTLSATSRFLLYNKKLWTEKKKLVLWGSGAYLCFWILFGILVGVTENSPGPFSDSVYYFFSFIVATFVASYMFYDIAKKNSRISVLMTPVSAIDAFVSRFLIVVVGYLLLSVLGLFVYHFANILTYLVVVKEMPQFYNPFEIFSEFAGPESIIFTVSGYLLSISIYIFGSVTWPKLSFLKTAFLLSVTQTIFWILLLIVEFSSSNGFYIEQILSFKNTAWILSSINFIFAFTLIYLSFRNFKRKTLIQKI